MMALSKILVAAGFLAGAIGGSYLGPVMGTMVATAIFAAPPAHAADWTGNIKAWPQNESVLSTSIQSVPYITEGLSGGTLRQAVTWVGTETLQREDGTCYTVTRKKLHITEQVKAQRVTVQETLESVDCPNVKLQLP